MAYSYTALPTATEVYAFLAGANITPGLAQTADAVGGLIGAAYRKVQRETGVQWLAGTAGEVRSFDGSGTGELKVDPFVTVTAVQFLIYPQATGVEVTGFKEVQRMGDMPKTRIQIFQGPSYAVAGYIDRFPQGRSNVNVTGTWGYAPTVPEDVFMAIVKQSAADIAALSAASAQGRVVDWREGDVTEQYADLTVGDAIGWLRDVQDTVLRRRLPYRERGKQAEAPLY